MVQVLWPASHRAPWALSQSGGEGVATDADGAGEGLGGAVLVSVVMSLVYRNQTPVSSGQEFLGPRHPTAPATSPPAADTPTPTDAHTIASPPASHRHQPRMIHHHHPRRPRAPLKSAERPGQTSTPGRHIHPPHLMVGPDLGQHRPHRQPNAVRRHAEPAPAAPTRHSSREPPPSTPSRRARHGSPPHAADQHSPSGQPAHPPAPALPASANLARKRLTTNPRLQRITHDRHPITRPTLGQHPRRHNDTRTAIDNTTTSRLI